MIVYIMRVIWEGNWTLLTLKWPVSCTTAGLFVLFHKHDMSS